MLGRPLIFFAPSFVVVEALRDVGRDSRIVGSAIGVPSRFLIFFPSTFTGKSSGLSGFCEIDIASTPCATTIERPLGDGPAARLRFESVKPS